MPLTLIEGTYKVIGAAPDGDSMKFYPKREQDWKLIGNPNPVRANQSGGAQLRLDGVDALETHYAPPGGGAIGSVHQPLGLAHAAANAALEWLGFSSVKRDASEKVTSATPDELDTARAFLATQAYPDGLPPREEAGEEPKKGRWLASLGARASAFLTC